MFRQNPLFMYSARVPCELFRFPHRAHSGGRNGRSAGIIQIYASASQKIKHALIVLAADAKSKCDPKMGRGSLASAEAARLPVGQGSATGGGFLFFILEADTHP